jgi:hypothetical protein
MMNGTLSLGDWSRVGTNIETETFDAVNDTALLKYKFPKWI